MANGKLSSPAPTTADLIGAVDPSGNLKPLLVDNAGKLEISGAFTASVTLASEGPTGSPVPADAIQIGGRDNSGKLNAIAVDASGNLSALPLPSGAAISAKQDTGNTSLASIDAKTPALGQALAAFSLPVTLTALEEDLIGALTETAPATDTASSGLNGRLQRIAQRLTSLIALIPASLGQKTMAGSFAVTVASDQTSFPVTLAAGSAKFGQVAIDQSTPGTTNGVQVNAALPAGTNVIGALTANQSVNVAQINGVAPLMGAGNTGTGSQRVTIATDQAAFGVNAAQSGTWTVQPGNTANTTPWLIQGAGSSAATNANSSVASTALEASHVIKAGAGRLYQLTGVNTKASAQYIQVFNSTTVPADTAVPILLAYVPAGGNFSFDFGVIGRYFSTGIAVSNSSTAATKTIGSADCWYNAEYL